MSIGHSCNHYDTDDRRSGAPALLGPNFSTTKMEMKNKFILYVRYHVSNNMSRCPLKRSSQEETAPWAACIGGQFGVTPSVYLAGNNANRLGAQLHPDPSKKREVDTLPHLSSQRPGKSFRPLTQKRKAVGGSVLHVRDLFDGHPCSRCHQTGSNRTGLGHPTLLPWKHFTFWYYVA